MTSELSILQNFRDLLVKQDPSFYLFIEDASPVVIFERLAAGYPSESFIFENHRCKARSRRMGKQWRSTT